MDGPDGLFTEYDEETSRPSNPVDAQMTHSGISGAQSY
jgi:hypothetical protein